MVDAGSGLGSWPGGGAGRGNSPWGWLSLGGGCNVAYQLRRLKLGPAPMPFDWLLIPVRSVVHILATDFREFMLPSHLQASAGGRLLRDTRYGTRLLHEADVVAQGGLHAVAAKYAGRVTAFRELVAGVRTIVAVRPGISHRAALRLQGLISQLFPEHRIVVIGVSEARAERADVVGASDHVLSYRLPATTHWRGSTEGWDWLAQSATARMESLEPVR